MTANTQVFVHPLHFFVKMTYFCHFILFCVALTLQCFWFTTAKVRNFWCKLQIFPPKISSLWIK